MGLCPKRPTMLGNIDRLCKEQLSTIQKWKTGDFPVKGATKKHSKAMSARRTPHTSVDSSDELATPLEATIIKEPNLTAGTFKELKQMSKC